MKRIGYIGNVEIYTGIMIGVMFVINREKDEINFHLILPFIGFSYTYNKSPKKNRYYGK